MRGEQMQRQSEPLGSTRRQFLGASTLAGASLGLPRASQARLTHAVSDSSPAASPAPPIRDNRACIMIFNGGGVSQLDTFDPKPLAPANVRGPYRAIRTAAPDIQLSELLPGHAAIADRIALVRGCHHAAFPVHEAGAQLMQTGHAAAAGIEYPHVGSVVSHLHHQLASQSGRKLRRDLPPFVVLGPQPSRHSSCNVNTGFLGPEYAPARPADDLANEHSRGLAAAMSLDSEQAATRERYGTHRLGRAFLRARRLVEAGVRFVLIQATQPMGGSLSWDTHGTGQFPAVSDLRRELAPSYDQAYSALVSDLQERGQLDATMVVAFSEFGRSPQLNAAGGRDHWPGCFTTVFAGGGVQGGQVVGASDRWAAEPADRPVSPAELLATIHHSLGVSAARTSEMRPVLELFG